MKLKVAINPTLIDKNEGGDTSKFVRGWINSELTSAELVERIGQGVAYCPQLGGDGRRRASNFACCNVLSVDMDGNRRIEEVLADPWVKDRLTIFYRTPNHTPDRHRFRLVFATERLITAAEDMRAASLSLALKLAGDPSVTDPCRIFFGSRGSNPTVHPRFIPDDELEQLIDEGRRSNQSDSYKSDHRATVLSNIRIDWKQDVRVAGGKFLPFKDIAFGTRVHCPFHYDEEPSAFILKSKTGTKGLWCSTCRKTFWPPGPNVPHFDFYHFDKTVKKVHAYYQEHADDVGLLKFVAEEGVHEGLIRSNIQIVNSRYLRIDKLKPGITFVKSPKGSGKTEVLRQLLKDTDRVLLIGHRVSLIGQSCGRLGLESYLSFGDGYLVEGRLGICLDSLPRLSWKQRDFRGKIQTKYNEFRTIVIDESEQVLSHFLGGTIDDKDRREVFLLFGRLLQQAERIVVLDADLNWLSFEMISKLANGDSVSRYWRPDKDVKSSLRPCHIIINEHTTQRRIEIIKTEEQLIADMIGSLRAGKRIFATSNSKNRIEQLSALIDEEFEHKLPIIQVTSDTTNNPEVRQLVENVRVEALKYRAILTSPSMGTGVDIAFDRDAEEFDVVYGFFHPLITTHFDCDQQIGRVRHPKATKVWVSPQRFSFDTSFEVISAELRERDAHIGLLSDFDEKLRPVYHTEDALFDLGALVVSQQRASKNDLKRHFIELKKAQGFEAIEHDSDPDQVQEGEELLGAARLLGQERLVALLTNADTLERSRFLEVRERLSAREHVSADELWSFQKTRTELFYRQKIDEALIETDGRGRFRQNVLAYEQLCKLHEFDLQKPSEFWKTMNNKTALGLKLLPSSGVLVPMLRHLLERTPIYDRKQLLLGVTFSSSDLTDFAIEALRLKGTVENITGVLVRRDVKKKPVMLLGRLLGLLGLAVLEVHRSVENGKKRYFYQLDPQSLADMDALVKKRADLKAWDALRQLYGMPAEDLEFDEDLYSDKDEEAA